MRTVRIFCCLMTTFLLIYYIYGAFVTISHSKTKVTIAKLIKQNPASSHLKSAKDGVLGVIESVKNYHADYKKGQDEELNKKIGEFVDKHNEKKSESLNDMTKEWKEELTGNFDKSLNKKSKELLKKAEARTRDIVTEHVEKRLTKGHKQIMARVEVLVKKMVGDGLDKKVQSKVMKHLAPVVVTLRKEVKAEFRESMKALTKEFNTKLAQLEKKVNSLAQATKPTKADPKKDAKADPKKDAKADPKKDAKADPKKDAKADPKKDAKANPMKDAKADPMKDAKADPMKDAKADPMKDAKAVTDGPAKVTADLSKPGVQAGTGIPTVEPKPEASKSYNLESDPLLTPGVRRPENPL
jgi:hypothetical protein